MMASSPYLKKSFDMGEPDCWIQVQQADLEAVASEIKTYS